MRRVHRRFPDLTFFTFAVTHQHVGARRAPAESGGQRQPDPHRQADPERAGRRFDQPELAPIGMALERRPEPAQRRQQVMRDVAGLGERGVEHGARVALGKDEAVTIFPERFVGTVTHDPAEVEHRDDVRGGEAAARMPRAGRRQHLDDEPADVPCTPSDFRDVEIPRVHRPAPFRPASGAYERVRPMRFIRATVRSGAGSCAAHRDPSRGSCRDRGGTRRRPSARRSPTGGTLDTPTPTASARRRSGCS